MSEKTRLAVLFASLKNLEIIALAVAHAKLIAIVFDVSLILLKVGSLEINWNLTLINFLGIFVALNYAPLSCK